MQHRDSGVAGLELPPAMSGARALRMLEDGSAPPGSVVFIRNSMRTLADVARDAEAFIRVQVGRLQGVLDKSAVIARKAKAITVQVVTVIDNADEFLSKLEPLVPDLEAIHGAVTEVLDLTNLVDEIMSFMSPVVTAVDNFVQTNIVSHLATAEAFITRILGYASMVPRALSAFA